MNSLICKHNHIVICFVFMLFNNKTFSSIVLNGSFIFCDELNNLKLVHNIDNCRNESAQI